MKLTLLGTGNAVVTACYNTCFLLEDNKNYLMVDAGGGNGILQQLKAVDVNWMDVRNIFITHKHMDHLLGMAWIIRLVCQSINRGTYEGDITIYGHDRVLEALQVLATTLLTPKETKHIGGQIKLITDRKSVVWERVYVLV